MNKLTYTSMMEELNEIVSQVENGELDIDELAEKVKRANFLVDKCKAKLTETEQEVNNVLEDI